MKIENQAKFMKNLVNVDDEDVISLGEYFNGVGSGINPRKKGCNEDCFDMHFLVLCELKRRGIFKGDIERFIWKIFKKLVVNFVQKKNEVDWPHPVCISSYIIYLWNFFLQENSPIFQGSFYFL